MGGNRKKLTPTFYFYWSEDNMFNILDLTISLCNDNNWKEFQAKNIVMFLLQHSWSYSKDLLTKPNFRNLCWNKTNIITNHWIKLCILSNIFLTNNIKHYWKTHKHNKIMFHLAAQLQTEIWKVQRQECFQTNGHRTVQGDERKWKGVIGCKFHD